MHDSVMRWVGSALTIAELAGKDVLEVGSYDVNGSVRPVIMAAGPARYLGVDQSPGPGVDMVADALRLPAVLGQDWQPPDIIVSTEMMEHVTDWKASLLGMITVLKPGGLLVITTRSPGFGYHGYPEDHWRYTVPQMQQIIRAVGLGVLLLAPDPDCEGVFVKACKPEDWAEPPGLSAAWDEVGVYVMTPEGCVPA